ncbi:hypothetical protein WDW89_11845 [Deltaproteobacteria bacterium TL4]
MLCEKMLKLQEISVKYPEQLDLPEWKEHWEQCEDCQQELKILKDSLALYLQVENPTPASISELDVWDELQAKLYPPPQQWQKFQWRVLSAAAMVTLVVGISGWWYSAQQITDIPSNYKVVDLEPDLLMTDSSPTRVVWNKYQFGLSIEKEASENETPNWHYSAISIGLRLSHKEQAFLMKVSPAKAKLADQKMYGLNKKKDA